jgi:hypothetical protein
MNYMKLYTASTIIYVAALLGVAQSVHAVTAKELFAGNSNGMTIKGTYVRKGTIGATIENVQALDKLLAEKGGEAEIAQLMKDQRPLGRSLYVLDLFEMQPIEGWFKDTSRQGKILVAVMTLEECPELMTPGIKARLAELKASVHPVVKGEIKSLLEVI